MGIMEQIHMELGSRPVRTIDPGKRSRSAVAVILTETPEGPEVLFIRRTIDENDLWSGQIGFPGGRWEERDRDLRQTAERETLEEVGVDLSSALYLGRIHDIAPGGLSMVVSCFVYALERPLKLHPDPSEIAGAFWFPLREIDNPARCTKVDFRFHGRLRSFPALTLDDFKGQPLWGISYRLLRNLRRDANGAIGS